MKKAWLTLSLLLWATAVSPSNPDDDDLKAFLPLIQFTPNLSSPPRSKPHTTLSHYIHSPDELYALECEAALGALGVPGSHVAIILHFGIASCREGELGVKTCDEEHTFRSVDVIRAAVLDFANGSTLGERLCNF